MEAGLLNNRVTIETRTASRNADTGDVTYSWATLVTRWAQIEPDGGGEPLAPGKSVTRTRYKLKARHCDTVAATDRVVWGSKTLNIESIVEDRSDDPDTWIITATEGSA